MLEVHDGLVGVWDHRIEDSVQSKNIKLTST